jgi:cyanophycin synthetase
VKKPQALEIYHGANVHAPQSVVICTLDMTAVRPALAQYTAGSFRALASANFADMIPQPPAGDSVTAVFASLLLQLVASLQRRARCEQTPHARSEIRGDDEIRVCFGFERQDIAVAALQSALAMIRGAIGDPESMQVLRERVNRQFNELAGRYTTTPSAQAVIACARARGIAVDRMGQGLAVFGEGRYQQRRIHGFTDRTSHIAFGLSSDKTAALHLLASRGFPVPRQLQVRSADEAVRAATQIGFPVVMKPLANDRGNGVSLNLRDADAVRRGWSHAAQFGTLVLVEQQIVGVDHRLLVLNGKFCAAAQRRHPTVVGDGKHAVRALVESLNADPARAPYGQGWLVRLEIDDELTDVLQTQGHALESVPKPGEVLTLRRVAAVATGADAIDVTARVHPDNVLLAEWIAALFAIDLCGIDFICPDIAESYQTSGGAICEVNTSPGLGPHIVAGDSGVIERVLETLYPPGAAFRVRKIVLVAEADDPAAIDAADALAEHLALTGATVGVAKSGSVTVCGVSLTNEPLDLPHAAGRLLAHPAVEIMIVLCTPADIAAFGLGIERCDVAVIDGDLASDAAGQAALAIATAAAATLIREAVSPAIVATVVQALGPANAPV